MDLYFHAQDTHFDTLKGMFGRFLPDDNGEQECKVPVGIYETEAIKCDLARVY